MKTSHHCALLVAQQAVTLLLQWAGSDSLQNYQSGITSNTPSEEAIRRTQKLLKWGSAKDIKPLRLLFDRIELPSGQKQTGQHYYPIGVIADIEPSIPYPNMHEPSDIEQNAFKQAIRDEILNVLQDSANWQNLSLLMLILEKYGSCLSFGKLDIALIDQVRIAGAIAAALASDPNAESLSLIAGDLSGIQNFIYTISSDGALKSLRARSFYLELVTEEVVQQLLAALDLPRTSVIYAGGGNLYLLASATAEVKQKTQQVHQQFNQWLRATFQKKIFLALDYLAFPTEDVATSEFTSQWDQIIRQLNQQKSRKFVDQITDVLSLRQSHEPCRVCHRDDTEDLKELNGSGSVLACSTCRSMFKLGSKLFNVRSMVRSHQENLDAVFTIPFKLANHPAETVYYHLFERRKPLIENLEMVFLINNWSIEDYKFRAFQGRVTSLLLGNYFQRGDEGFMQASEFAEQAQGIDRVGYLRMDVDNLGQIFAKGLSHDYSLTGLAGLSRQISYFFKTYLNSLASARKANFLQYNHRFSFQHLPYLETTDHAASDRKNLLFIYAGGDDLFVSGAWNEVVEFAFDVYQSFRAYTGYHPAITLSGGISIAPEKFPLYQAAREAEEAEKAAKGAGRDCLALFGEVFKWSGWLGNADLHSQDEEYLSQAAKPELVGVLPFVQQLIDPQQLAIGYSRSFIRNLLITAQIREQKIAESQQKQPEQIQAITYFLHLPKLAYTLSRLPQRVRDDPKFIPIRQSLMSPRNSPYFRAIATWIELLTRTSTHD